VAGAIIFKAHSDAWASELGAAAIAGFDIADCQGVWVSPHPISLRKQSWFLRATEGKGGRAPA